MNNEVSQPGSPGGDVDLFGAPIGQIRERWGRPSFSKSKENQQLVITLRGAGWTMERIAKYMRCDVGTLRNHFPRELTAAAEFLEGQALEVLVSAMRRGRVDAARRVMEIVQAGRAAVPLPKGEEKDELPGSKPLGKKAQQSEAAKNPGAGWGQILPH